MFYGRCEFDFLRGETSHDEKQRFQFGFGTPQETINKIHAGALKILAEPKFRDFLLKGGYESSPKSIKDFIKFVQSEKIRYGEIVKSAQIELQ